MSLVLNGMSVPTIVQNELANVEFLLSGIQLYSDSEAVEM